MQTDSDHSSQAEVRLIAPFAEVALTVWKFRKLLKKIASV